MTTTDEDQTDEIERLRALNRNMGYHIAALQSLLAVIYSYARLPIPVKDDWQAYYATAATRLERIGHATCEPGMSSALRWASTLQRWTETGIEYTPDPMVMPKPAAVDDDDENLILLGVMTAAERRGLLARLAGHAPETFDLMVRRPGDNSLTSAQDVYRTHPAHNKASAAERRMLVIEVLTDYEIHTSLAWWAKCHPSPLAEMTRPPAISVGESDDMQARVYALYERYKP